MWMIAGRTDGTGNSGFDPGKNIPEMNIPAENIQAGMSGRRDRLVRVQEDR